MLKKLSVIIVSLIICLPIVAAGTATSLEDGINQLAIDMSKQMQKKGIKKIAIDDFTDLNGYKSGLGDFISEELVTSFYTQGEGNFEVVERRELARVLKEQKLGGSGLLNKTTIAKIGKILGIDAIVTGSIAYLGSSIKVNARMIGVNNAKVFAATSQKMLKDETVEALLEQGARVDNVSSSQVTSNQKSNTRKRRKLTELSHEVFGLKFEALRLVRSGDQVSVKLAITNTSKEERNIQARCYKTQYESKCKEDIFVYLTDDNGNRFRLAKLPSIGLFARKTKSGSYSYYTSSTPIKIGGTIYVWLQFNDNSKGKKGTVFDLEFLARVWNGKDEKESIISHETFTIPDIPLDK